MMIGAWLLHRSPSGVCGCVALLSHAKVLFQIGMLGRAMLVKTTPLMWRGL